MPPAAIALPHEYNYVAAFLTLACNYRCRYCINHPGDATCVPRRTLTAREWTDYLNRLALPADLPVTLQGGEPSQHPEFYELLAGLREGLRVDLLTNLSFDVAEFAERVSPARFLREAPYPAIRVTYHPGQSPLDDLLKKVTFLRDRGYPIGLYAIRAPGTEKMIEGLRERATRAGLDFRTKEYLGLWRGEVHGTYHYPEGVFARTFQNCQCRTTELLIAPDGSVYRCHRDLYAGEHRVGSILDEAPYTPEYRFRECARFGDCNPCDLKRKTNRFQIDGHASVEIQFEAAPA